MPDESTATVVRPASGESDTVEERVRDDTRLEPSDNRFRIPECVLNDAEKMRTIGHRHVDYLIECGNRGSIQENVESDWESFAEGLNRCEPVDPATFPGLFFRDLVPDDTDLSEFVADALRSVPSCRRRRVR